MQLCEHGINPNNAEHADKKQGGYGRRERIPHPADDIGKDIHKTAQGIGRHNDHQSDEAGRNNRRLRGINRHQLPSEQTDNTAQRKTEQTGNGTAVKQNLSHPFDLPRPDILPRKGQSGLRGGVTGGINKALDAGCGRITGHDG